MKKAADYHRHAEECRALAATMDREDQREQLHRMAAQWDQLAEDRRRFDEKAAAAAEGGGPRTARSII